MFVNSFYSFFSSTTTIFLSSPFFILIFSNEKLVHTSIKQSTKKKIPSILINNLAAPNGLIITTFISLIII